VGFIEGGQNEKTPATMATTRMASDRVKDSLS
jgi:hypothetical protein